MVLPRGPLLYFPLAVSLCLNSLWFPETLTNLAAPVSRTFHALVSSGAVSVSGQLPFSHPSQDTDALAVGPQGTHDGQACSDEALQKGREAFHDVVLVVSFATDATARNAASFVRAIYSRMFLEVVVCAPTVFPELGIEGRGERSWGKNPAHQYYFFPKMVLRHPSAAGFLFAAGDVIVLYWNYAGVNKSRLWLSGVPGCPSCRPPFVSLSGTAGKGHLESAAQRRGVKAAIHMMDSQYRAQLNESLRPHADGYPTRVSDIFYVPRRFASALAFYLIPAFRDSSVMQDIAVPTAFFALEAPSEWDPVLSHMLYLDEVGPNFEPDVRWREEVPAYHFWDLSSQEHRTKLLAVLARTDSCLQGAAVDGL